LIAHRQPATDAPTDGTEPVKIHEKCRGRSDHADPRGLVSPISGWHRAGFQAASDAVIRRPHRPNGRKALPCATREHSSNAIWLSTRCPATVANGRNSP